MHTNARFFFFAASLVLVFSFPIISDAHKASAHSYADTAASIRLIDRHSGTDVEINVYNAQPNHLHTVWFKIDGLSPLSGIGATPVIPTSEIDNNWMVIPGTPVPGAYGFYTNSADHGALHIE